MTPRRTVLSVLVLFTLAMPGVVGSGFAAPVPDYFADESVGFVCLNATPPGVASPIPVLVQFNFDKVASGGIPLARADSLFAYLRSNLGLLSPVIGPNPQVANCSLNPSQTLAQFPGATALQAAQQVSGTFQQLGFARYYIVDAFLSFTILYFGSVDTLRTEVFRVDGNNALTYVSSNEIDESLVP